jgi:cytoskeleton protein RodZ
MPSIGETLRAARIKAGASEDTVAKILKIKVDRLKDLEENRFDKFAAPVYVRGFLKHYATYLNLDSAEILKQYDSEVPAPQPRQIFSDPTDPHSTTILRPPPQVQNSNFVLTTTGQVVMIVGVLLVLGAFGVYWLTKNNQETSAPVLVQEPAGSIEPSEEIVTPNSSPESSGLAPENQAAPMGAPLEGSVAIGSNILGEQGTNTTTTTATAAGTNAANTNSTESASIPPAAQPAEAVTTSAAAQKPAAARKKQAASPSKPNTAPQSVPAEALDLP